MIVTVGGTKGGSGKSTVAVMLATMRALAGENVLLVDADEQGSAADFAAQRQAIRPAIPCAPCQRIVGPDVRTAILGGSGAPGLRAEYADIVIDTGGRDTTSQRAALSVADVMLVPVLPRALDVWALAGTESVVRDMRQANDQLRALSFLNRADPAGQENAEAAGILAASAEIALLAATIGNRKVFGNAVAVGLTAGEYRPLDRKAAAEIAALYALVFGQPFTPVNTNVNTKGDTTPCQ